MVVGHRRYMVAKGTSALVVMSGEGPQRSDGCLLIPDHVVMPGMSRIHSA